MTDTLLISMGAPLYRSSSGELFIERQTVSGLEGWNDNFGTVLAYAICHDRPAPPGHVPVGNRFDTKQIEVYPLPNTFGIGASLKNTTEAKRIIGALVARSDFRVFGIDGWIGDPGLIATSLARKAGKPYAIWFDRVESQVIAHAASAKLRLKSKVVRHNENRAVRRADLTLLHGQTVYEHFKGIARQPQIVEDIHFHEEDRLSATARAAKIEKLHGRPLRIVYCGRATGMKGGLDWIDVLAKLKEKGGTFQATWVGDGDLLPKMREAAARSGLEGGDIDFTGFIDDREVVREHYREADLLLFCHMTDESPRNLIESLHSATPLVGFADPYSRALVAEKGAGHLVDRGDKAALAEALWTLHEDRTRLADLIERAGASATHLTREHVFRHRSELVRTYLP